MGNGIVGVHQKPIAASASLADHFLVVIDGAVRRAKIETIIDCLAETQTEGIYDAIARAEEVMYRIDAFTGATDFKISVEANSDGTGYDLVMRTTDGTEISRSPMPRDLIGSAGGSTVIIGDEEPATEGPVLWFDTSVTVNSKPTPDDPTPDEPEPEAAEVVMLELGEEGEDGDVIIGLNETEYPVENADLSFDEESGDPIIEIID